MGTAKELIGVPAPFQLEAKPRLCRTCGLPKMTGRAANAMNCLDCGGGVRRDRQGRRKVTAMRPARLPYS